MNSTPVSLQPTPMEETRVGVYDDDPIWDALFAESQDMLVTMADEAFADYHAGRTQPMDYFLERAQCIAATPLSLVHRGISYAVTWEGEL